MAGYGHLKTFLYTCLIVAAHLHGTAADTASSKLPARATSLGSSQQQAATSSSSSRALTASVLGDLGQVRGLVYDFWQLHGPDEQWGGFHGTLDRAGQPVEPFGKGLVQQARHVWAFSTYHLDGYRSSAAAKSSAGRPETTLRRPTGRRMLQQRQQQQQRLPSSQQMAKTAYDFVVAHMHDPSTDLFHWFTTRDGQLLQDNKVIYGQWFVLYSFSQYFTAFRDPQARDLALRCFRAMDAAWHSSTFGGFDELPENEIPPSPPARVVPTKSQPEAAAIATAKSSSSKRGLLSGAAASAQPIVRALPASAASSKVQAAQAAGAASKRPAAVQQREQKVRTLNVAMHGLEALTALHKVTRDATVLARIHEYLHILCTRLARTDGLIFEEYVPVAAADQQWQPAPGSVVNYGHNLESTWLVADTVDYLQSIRTIRPALAQQYRETVMSIGAAAVRDGFDNKLGGVFESGLPFTGPQSKAKVWWVQAESMLALWKLHQYYDGQGPAAAPAQRRAAAGGSSSGSSSSLGPQFLRKLAQTARFVRQFSTDAAGGGDMFWQVEPDGSWAPSNNLERDTKGNIWKASYHNSRSVLFLQRWISNS